MSGGFGVPTFRKLPVHDALELRGNVRVFFRISLKTAIPIQAQRGTSPLAKHTGNAPGHPPECGRAVPPASPVALWSNGPPQRQAAPRGPAAVSCLCGLPGEADVGANLESRRAWPRSLPGQPLTRGRPCQCCCSAQFVGRAEPNAAKRARRSSVKANPRVAFNRNVIVSIEDDELAQPQVTGH